MQRRLKGPGRRRIDARSDDAEARMAEVRKGVDRVKELMERHDVRPRPAPVLMTAETLAAVRRSARGDRRGRRGGAGGGASMRDRYSGGAPRPRTGNVVRLRRTGTPTRCRRHQFRTADAFLLPPRRRTRRQGNRPGGDAAVEGA